MNVMLTDDLLPLNQLTRTEFFSDCLRPEGAMAHAAGLKVFHEASRFAALSVHYGDRQAERYNREVPRALRTIAPHLQAALEVQRHLSETHRVPRTVTDLVDAFSTPACLLTAERRLVHANRPFSQELNSGDLLRLDLSERVGFREVLQERAFQQSVAAAVTPAREQANPRPSPARLEIPTADQLPTVVSIFKIRSLAAGGLGWLWNARSYALVTVERPRWQQRRKRELLYTRFGLTPGEAVLAELIADGSTLRTCAQRLGVTYETARSRLKHVLAKVGVHRQADLILLLAGV